MGLDRSQVLESPGSFSVAKPRTFSLCRKKTNGPLNCCLESLSQEERRKERGSSSQG